jgi:hypothetical protein
MALVLPGTPPQAISRADIATQAGVVCGEQGRVVAVELAGLAAALRENAIQ